MLVRIGLLTTPGAKFEPEPHINAALASRSPRFAARWFDLAIISDQNAFRRLFVRYSSSFLTSLILVALLLGLPRHDAMLSNTPSRRIRPWKSAAPKWARNVKKSK
jgi:hypothetical protein